MIIIYISQVKQKPAEKGVQIPEYAGSVYPSLHKSGIVTQYFWRNRS